MKLSHKPEASYRPFADDDHDLVIQCRKGDVDAFEVLVKRYQRKIINTAYRLTGDYEEACEIAQETFLSAYRALGKFRGEAKFSTWLTGIAMNHARNRLKKLQSQHHYEITEIHDSAGGKSGYCADDAPAGEAIADERLEQKETRAKVRECIGKLDGEFREVLVLRDIEGFSYDEIKESLRLPEGTVKSRLFRARESLRNCLEKVLRDYARV